MLIHWIIRIVGVERVVRALRRMGYVVREREELIENLEKARRARRREILARARRALEEMKAEGIKPTPYRLARRAGINYRTAKKLFRD